MNKQALIDKYSLNDAQADVVVNNDKELIVPAGAGSGKTKTLVTNVVELLKQGNSLDNFLVLTFTNKAAKEMKARIKLELVNEGLIQMANKIDSSNISTFDAFANNFVKQNASAIGLDANIEILDAAVFKMIKDDIMNDIIIEIMLNKTANIQLYEFLELYTDKTSEEQLVNDLINAYYNLTENGLIKDLKVDNLILNNNIFNGRKLKSDLLEVSADFVNEYEAYLDMVVDYFDYLAGSIATMPTLDVPRSFSWKKLGIDDNSKKAIIKIYKPYKDLIAIKPNREDIVSYYSEERATIENILEILRRYEQSLITFKSDTNKYEFNDIANFLNQILRENSDILQRQKDKFIYTFVDEYQDTSKVQADFLEMLIKDNEKIKVLYVGDIKQSIYKFRNARPDTFINKLNTIQNIGLSINYRSSKGIIDFVNNIFKEIMDDKDKYDIDYKDNHYMDSGSTKFNDDLSATVFLEEVYKSEDDKLKQFDPVEEAFVIGYKIKGLMKEKKIKKFSDVAILARNKANFKIFSDVFDYLDIPIQIQVDQKLKQTYMLKLIANILKLSQLINNSDSKSFKDMRFFYYSVARSELYEESDYNLFKSLINTSNELKPSLHMNEDIKTKARLLNNIIKTKTNYEIIDNVITMFSVYEKITKALKREEKEYQIQYLYDISKTLSDLNIVGNDFVNYIYNIAYDEEIDLQIGILQDKDEDSVKITNIHQSKGLEYNTLFLAGLNKKFNRETVRKFKYNDITKFNIRLKVKDDNNNIEHISSYVQSIKQQLKLSDNLKEEIRLLYVAITRAEKALYILTTPKEDYSELSCFTDYLYEHGVRKFVDPKNITTYESPVKDSSYYLNSSDKNLYYPKQLDELIDIDFGLKTNVVEKTKASITTHALISTTNRKDMLAGTKMHLDFEYMNKDNPLVNNFYLTKFNNKKLDDAELLFEYEFSYIKDNKLIKGIIDLVAIYNDQVHIIDYKLRDIDPSKYEKQLLIYKDYLSNIFDKEIKLYLYSIIKGTIVEIT